MAVVVAFWSLIVLLAGIVIGYSSKKRIDEMGLAKVMAILAMGLSVCLAVVIIVGALLLVYGRISL